MAALVAACVILIAIVLYRSPSMATAKVPAVGPMPHLSAFHPDQLTPLLRDSGRKLVRIETDTLAGRDRAGRSGTVVQDFGRFVIVSQLARTRSKDASDQVLPTTINLPGATFDPSSDTRIETVSSGISPGSGYYIVQFAGVVTDEWLDDLRSLGIEILQYVPHRAFFVYGHGDAIAKVAEHYRVRWVGSHLPGEKVSDVLRTQLSAAGGRGKSKNSISNLLISDGRAKFNIAVFARADLESVAQRINAITGADNSSIVRLPNNFFNIIQADVPLDKINEISAIPDVVRIDSSGEREAEDERAAQIVAGNYSSPTVLDAPGYDPLTQFGVDGTNVTVAVADDGISIPGNGGFYITSSNTKDGPLRGGVPGATSGHGHINASIIAGRTPFGILDPLGYNYGLGIAPNANIVNIPLLQIGLYTANDQTSYDDQVNTLGVNGVRVTISNNSWGEGTNMNGYDSLAAEFDGFVRDSSIAGSIDPLSLVFSAGNNGPGAMSLTRPKAAKNLIAVANSENIRTEFSATGANNMDDLDILSSRGFTADGRVKPDVTAPGSFITGSRAGDCNGVSLCFDANHAYSSGTSHAAPQVAGAAALFTQFWRSENLGQDPSPALIKAAIINSAQEMNGANTGSSVPNGSEGWGRLNMKQMFNVGFPIVYINQRTQFLNVGDSLTYQGTVIDPSKPVRVTLVWTDPPAANDPALVNDLDLTVTLNGSTTYRGNVFSGGVSTTGGSNSTIDNVENVFLLAGTAAGAPMDVTVTAAALYGDGILGNADLTDQDFALVIYNFALRPTAAPADIQGRVTDESGIGIPRTSVTLSSSEGRLQIATTNTFGYYRFADIPTGRSYFITPSNKRYSFDPPLIFFDHLDRMSDMNFVAHARRR